jgi:hypothetical protein
MSCYATVWPSIIFIATSLYSRCTSLIVAVPGGGVAKVVVVRIMVCCVGELQFVDGVSVTGVPSMAWRETAQSVTQNPKL